jgi:hypothetical protein
MSDTITQSVYQGFNMAQQMESQKRLAEAQKMQAVAQNIMNQYHMMQMQGLQQKNLQEQQIIQMSQPTYGENIASTQNPAMNPRAKEIQPETSPYVRSVQSQYSPALWPAIEADMMMGRTVDETKYQKLPSKEIQPKMLGLDPQTMQPVFKHPASGMTYTLDPQTMQPQIYQIKSQLKTTTEPAPLFQMVPGYQTPQGQPVPFSMRSGQPSVPGELQKTPSESDVAEARKMTKVTALFGSMEKAFEAAKDSLPKTTLDRITGWPARKIKVLSQSDPKLAIAYNLTEGMLANWARNVQGEVGVLTDQDTARARPIMWNINDTPEVRKLKKQALTDLTLEIYNRGKRQENPLGNAPGSNAPPFDATIQKGGSYDYEYVPGKGLMKAR